MKWNEVRKAYPDKWIVFDSLKQHEENNVLYIEEVALIEVFDDLDEAWKYYHKIHKEDKTRNLNIGDTKKEDLSYKIKRFGMVLR